MMLTDLLVEVKVRQGQLDRFSDFLFLHVQSTDIGISDIWLLVRAEHSYRRVGFGREDIDKRV